MENKSDFLKFSIQLAKDAGKIQMSYFGKVTSLNKKSNSIDLLTIADKESETYIINKIKKNYPDHSILSEETGEINNENKYKWIIDPLDGTTNFVHNLPIFAVSIALQKNNKTICAVVYNPAVEKCFYAQKDSPAGSTFLNHPIPLLPFHKFVYLYKRKNLSPNIQFSF